MTQKAEECATLSRGNKKGFILNLCDNTKNETSDI